MRRWPDRASMGARPMAEERDPLRDWHRLFGLLLADFFTGSPFRVELERDLSIQQQLLDVVIGRGHRALRASNEEIRAGATATGNQYCCRHLWNQPRRLSPLREVPYNLVVTSAPAKGAAICKR